MALFYYRGTTPDGKTVEGEMQAESQAEVIASLRKRNVIPVAIELKKKKALLSLEALTLGKVSASELALFTKQFGTMLEAGLPLLDALNTQYRQTRNRLLKNAIREIARDVEGGYTLAESMKKHKRVFSELYVNMVEAGEKGGALGEILARLAEYLEKMADIQRKIKGAMIYPIIVICVMIIAVAALLIFVIPTFADLYKGFGAQLPGLTRLVIGISNFVKGNILLILAILIGTIAFIMGWYKTTSGKEVLDRVILRIPIIGPLVHKNSLARFARTLSTLLNSGVDLMEAMEITARTTGNRVVQHGIMRARNSIREGSTIARPLEQSRIFPPLVVQMVAIGEQSGNLDEMLSKVADFYDKEVDAAVEALTTALEPIIMVILGGIVGTMVISMYLPIFKLIPTLMEKFSH
ncbi:MAG: type II secretion system F family protein [candidate division WOR-3 bacterium]